MYALKALVRVALLTILIQWPAACGLQFSSKAPYLERNYYFIAEQWELKQEGYLDTAAMAYYSDLLRYYDEESFYREKPQVDAYRFLIGVAFRKSYLLRIENDSGVVSLYWQESLRDQDGVMELPTPEKRTILSREYWQRLNALMEEAGFWQSDMQKKPLAQISEAADNYYEGWVHQKHQVLLEYNFPTAALKSFIQELRAETDIKY